MDVAEKLLAPLICDTDCSRSVQGAMNQMAQDIGIMLEHDNASVMALAPCSTGAWLANRPCSVKGDFWADRAMLELLEGTSESTTKELP
jgi:hypothetical protein